MTEQCSERPKFHWSTRSWPPLDEGGQKRSWLVRQAWQRHVGIELDSGVKLPADEQHRMAGAQSASGPA